MNTKPEVWLRGPLLNMPGLLQPVAHALLQAREEVNLIITDFPDSLLWNKPAGLGSVAFHLQHLKGVLDRLFTYAKGEQLSPEQLAYLAAEGKTDEKTSVAYLVTAFNKQVDLAMAQLEQTDDAVLTEARGVGRANLPSTIIGLYVHAAEHTTRHLGQLLVTVKFLKEGLSG